MKLYQVRKGQFVYYNNELHKVYGVKPMFKQSVHLIRLRDLTQQLSKAVEVERYRPKEFDSFVFNYKAYTLVDGRMPEEGDYILIHHPRPDSLDTYTLNEIETVESVDKKGVITSNSHGVKHNEYLLMVPGRLNNSHPIDFKDTALGAVNIDHLASEHHPHTERLPLLGDVYIKKDSMEFFETMVVAIKGQTVYLGNGTEILKEELMNTDKWEFLYNFLEK
ncbi:MAG: hypothetical protein ACO1OC_10705 [Tuberibacillus sp.]